MSKNTDVVTIGQLCTSLAETLDMEPGMIAKKMRARIRNNFDTVAAQWPGLSDAKDNRDGNRYPPMPRECADYLTALMTAKASKEPKAGKESQTVQDEKAARKAAKKAKKAKKAAKLAAQE